MGVRINSNGTAAKVMPRNGKAFELSELQAMVGGYIEAYRISDDRWIVMNEDGKRMRLAPNIRATRLAFARAGIAFSDVVVGDVVIATTIEMGEDE